MNTLFRNETFALHEISKNNYHFEMQPNKGVNQDHINLLSNSIRLICNNDSGKQSSIILDCSRLNTLQLVSQFYNLCFTGALDITNVGLKWFIIVTTSDMLVSLTAKIIVLKSANSYTKVVSTLQEAFSFIEQ